MKKTMTIQNGLTSKNITDLNGATIISAGFASKSDHNELNDNYGWMSHDPIILIRVRLKDGTLVELMPTADPECNGPGFLEVIEVVDVTKKEPE